MLDIAPIGTVSTPFETADAAPRQGFHEDAPGTIVIDDQYESALRGIEPGDDLIVIWFADESDRTLLTVDRESGIGVFNSRSNARPNPICLTTCRVEGISGTEIAVTGVDMTDGSPVLDLKPPLKEP